MEFFASRKECHRQDGDLQNLIEGHFLDHFSTCSDVLVLEDAEGRASARASGRDSRREMPPEPCV